MNENSTSHWLPLIIVTIVFGPGRNLHSTKHTMSQKYSNVMFYYLIPFISSMCASPYFILLRKTRS